MSVLLQISDPHFGTERPPVMRALHELARRLRPELVVLSGDVTQRARGAQFEAARRFVDELAAPAVLAIPGNHDIPLYNFAMRALLPYRNYRRAFGAELEPEFESEALQVTGVNTTRPGRHKNGAVSAGQVARVARRLSMAAARQARIVVVHQPVHVIRRRDERNLLRGREQAVRSWAAAGADIVMGGHIHLPYVRSLDERYDGLPRRVWTVQAGTAVSTRVRGDIPNSVNVLRHPAGATECLVERWDFDAAGAAFQCVTRDALILDR